MLRISAILGSILTLSAVCQAAAPPLPAQLEGVGISERLGEKVDLNLTFVNESGKLVRLGEYFRKDRPVILNLVYYSCPMLCTLVLNGQTAALRNIPGSPGKDFEIVTISIDPSETPDLAREKKQAYIGELGRGGEGWHFLSDHDGNVQRLAAQVGFHYRYDESIRQYAHAAAIMILTPRGACPAICTASSLGLATCGWRWRRHPLANFPPASTACCCSATTTTPPPAPTCPSRPTS